MRFSLVVGSLLRPAFLDRLLTSLEVQSMRGFEVIIVEQRDPEGVSRLLLQHPGLSVKLLSSERGLSRARNVGLCEASGDVVGFPDDDCWYLPGTLQRAAALFENIPDLGVLCGRVATPDGNMIPYPGSTARITAQNAFRVAVSPGMFVSKRAADTVGSFDELLGVGSQTAAKSGEETDYVLRAIGHGFTGLFDPYLTVMHPSPREVGGRLNPRLGYGYGYGMGAVLRKTRAGPLRALGAAARPFAGAGVAAAGGDSELARFRIAVARGRMNGFVRGIARRP